MSMYKHNFKMSLEEEVPGWWKHVGEMVSDCFPSLKWKSTTTILLLLEVMIYALPPQWKGIKPYFGFSSLLPWLLCPFVTPSLEYLLVHLLFLLAVVAQLEASLKNPFRLLALFMGLPVLGSLAVKAVVEPQALLLTNQGTFALYTYLCLLQSRPPRKVQLESAESGGDEKVEAAYKCIFLSYLVFAGCYSIQGTHFSAYLFPTILLTLFYVLSS